MKKLLLIICLIAISFHVLPQSRTSYVSLKGKDTNSGEQDAPYKSVQQAINACSGEGEAIIYILEGIYQLDSPLIITPELVKGISGLSIESLGSDKVLISGGREITGWKVQKDGIWTCVIPEVKSGKWKFKQIYVNGELRRRARKPNEEFLRVVGMPEGTPNTVGYHTDCQSFEYAEGDISSAWKNPDDVEVIVYHFWTDSHLPIESIDEKSNIVTFKHKAGKVFTDDFSEEGARYIVENVFEELDTAGEWYLDKKTGTCYYYPFPDEKIQNTRIIAPVSDQLIRIEGDPASGNYIKNIHFKNIEFCYTNWGLPPGNSNDQQGSASVPAAISLLGAKDCSFENCRLFNLGTWAFELNDGCSDNTFSYNVLEHIGAGGFRINGGDYDEHPFLRNSNNTISHNLIHHYGEVYPSAVGILIQKSAGNLISENHIHHGFYTGISIGWEWGYQRSISRDNIIEYNHIHDIGQGLLSDMGAIYTLGVSPGTILRNNIIHDVDANHYGGWGIYHDEGSTHILDENNIVYNTKFAAFNIHYAKEITVRNNIFALGRLQQINRTRSEPHISVYFEQNIVYWKEGKLLTGAWEDKAHAFYFHPKNDGGTDTVSSTFEMDYNLYFNPLAPQDSIRWNGLKWEDWHARGKDKHSIYADPLFIDPDQYNFQLKANSPAFQLGFQAIDMRKTLSAGEKAGPHLQ